jgi:hypothetical protein
MLSAGIIGCLGIFALIVGVFGLRDVGRLLAGRGLSHADSSASSGRVQNQVAEPVTPPVATGSPPAGVALNLPPAVAPSEAALEPVAAGAERPHAAPQPPSMPGTIGSPTPTELQLSPEEITALVARGDAFLRAGDVASARLFFQRAADAGDGRAAMRMAVTFDAGFLDRAGVHGLRGDPEQAAFWYRRGRDLEEAKTELGPAPSIKSPSPLR